MFYAMQMVLQQDVTEFQPYFVQIVAQVSRHPLIQQLSAECDTFTSIVSSSQGLLTLMLIVFILGVSCIKKRTIPGSQRVRASASRYSFLMFTLKQLLERRATPIPAIYMQILPTLLQQPLWASRSNQPALTRLIKAYISRASEQIVAEQAVFHQILGLVQFLMMAKVRYPACVSWSKRAIFPAHVLFRFHCILST